MNSTIVSHRKKYGKCKKNLIIANIVIKIER